MESDRVCGSIFMVPGNLCGAPTGPSGGYTQKEAACVKLRYCSGEGSKTPLTCQASEAPPCRLWSPRDRRYH